MVLLDLSAEFNTVNHSLLLSRFYESFGISGTVLKWFRLYLSDHNHFVNINEAASTICDFLVAVPQGSVLALVLYLMYLIGERFFWYRYPIACSVTGALSHRYRVQCDRGFKRIRVLVM